MSEEKSDKQIDLQPQQSLVVNEEYRRRYQESLLDIFKSAQITIGDIKVYAINSKEDLETYFYKVHRAGSEAQKGNVVGLMIRPDSSLFKDVYATLGSEATRYSFIPTGLENIADHENNHILVAEEIKKGNGLSNKFGARRNFLFCLKILVYPDFREIHGEKFSIPVTNIGTLISYDDSMSIDERLAINFEIIVAARKSKDGLSPSDIDQIKQILKHQSAETPITNQVVESLKSELPISLFEI